MYKRCLKRILREYESLKNHGPRDYITLCAMSELEKDIYLACHGWSVSKFRDMKKYAKKQEEAGKLHTRFSEDLPHVKKRKKK